MNRSKVVLPALVVLAAVMAGCSNGEQGNPHPAETPSSTSNGSDGLFPTSSSRPTGSSSTSSSSSNSPLAGASPCSLLTDTETSKLAVEGRGVEQRLNRARACEYSVPEGTLGVALFDDLGAKDINATEKTPIRVGTHEAVRGLGGATCAITFGLTETSRVDVKGTHISGDSGKSCEMARQVAELVEPKLPR